MSEWMRRLIKKNKKRLLQDGKAVDELDKPVELRVYTRCPEKYKLVDMETGEEYTGVIPNGLPDQKFWKRIKK